MPRVKVGRVKKVSSSIEINWTSRKEDFMGHAGTMARIGTRHLDVRKEERG